MSNEYEEAFKGTREMAEAAAKKTQQYLQKCVTKADGKKIQIRFAISVLHSACVAAAAPDNGIHYDLYCDILVTQLARYLEPSAAPNYWTRYLEVIRYFHYLMVHKKEFSQASRVFNYLSEQTNAMQSEGDYKYVFSVYGQHFMAQRFHPKKSIANQEIDKVLEAMTKFLKEMLRLNTELNFVYAELIDDFIQLMFLKRFPIIYNYSSPLPAIKTEMFNAFFNLLGHQKMPSLSDDKLACHMQSHLDAFTVFLQFDIVDKLQLQLAMQHLQTCMENNMFQNDKSMHYMISLFNYLVKVVYTRSMRKYIEISIKFQEFCQKSAEGLLQNQWFLDSLVAVTIFHNSIHQPASQLLFAGFFSKMISMDALTTHLQFLLCLIKLAPNVNQSNLMVMQCCSSTRKHVIISLATSAVAAYEMFLANCKNILELESDKSKTQELHNLINQIVRHAVKVFETMQCINPEATALKSFIQRFLQLTINTTTATHANLCYKLAELISKLKERISKEDWITFMRRIYKTTKLMVKTEIGTDLQCCFIATIAMEEPTPNLSMLRNQIAIFYNQNNVVTTTTTLAMRDKCLLDMYPNINSPFKPQLMEHHKRLLYNMEMQHVIKYYKTHEPLLISLMGVSQSDYELVLIARAAKQLKVGVEKVKCLEERFKEANLSGLKRLDKLIYGHVMTILLYIKNDAQKHSWNVDTKDCQENAIEELLMREECAELSISNELNLIEIAVCSLQCFKSFFDEADSEHISSDVALIDWEAIVDDVATLGLYLQLTGYIEHASKAWLFFYQLTTHLQDSCNQLRAISFFCENCNIFAEYKDQLNLADAVAKAQITIVHALPLLGTQLKRVQNHILICLSQLAFYHAQQRNYCYAQMLLDCVELEHRKLEDRQGKFDIVLATAGAVKFRILWLHAGSVREKAVEQPKRNFDHFGLFGKSLLNEIEVLLELIPEIVFLSSTDSTLYMILINNLVQEFSECAANRLCDNFFGNHMVAVFKLAIKSGLILRMVQLLSMWMWTNLQMENIDKAQSKLNLIEHLLAVKRLESSQEKIDDVKLEASFGKSQIYEIPSNELLAIQPMRKLAQSHLSPIRTSKLKLHPSVRKRNLQNFLSMDLPQFRSPTLQWTYFLVGCLCARLYFLIEDYEQLDSFYEQTEQWLQDKEKETPEQRLLFVKNENVKILCTQHCVNFLRANGKYEKALGYIEQALERCRQLTTKLDTVYWYNFELQRLATQNEIKLKDVVIQRQSLSRLRRALEFNVSPEDKVIEVENKVKPNVKAQQRTVNPLPIRITKSADKLKRGAERSARKVGTTSSSDSTRSRSSSNCSETELDCEIIVVTPPYANGNGENLNVCQTIQTIDLDDTVEEHTPTQATASVIKSLCAPSTAQVKKSTKKRTASTANIQDGDIPVITLNDDISCGSQNTVEDTDDLSAQMQNLKVANSEQGSTIKSKTSKRSRLCSKPITKSKSNCEIVILEDSPIQNQGKLKRSASNQKPSTTATNVNAATTSTSNTLETPVTKRRVATESRSLRRAISANLENIEPVAPRSVSTRRRMKT